MRHVVNATPVVLGGALVIPAGLLRRLRGESGPDIPSAGDGGVPPADPVRRARIERLAMDAVRRAEEARGCRVVDVSAQKCGWDLTSYPPPDPSPALRAPSPIGWERAGERGAGSPPSPIRWDRGGERAQREFSPPQPSVRHIEVKGRAQGATTITVTRNEILYALNQADKFVLAVVFVGEDDAVEGPHFIRNPFDAEPGWGVASVNYDLGALIEHSQSSEA